MTGVRLGVVGLGAIGRVHLERTRELDEGELTAVSDIEPSLTHAVAKEYGVEGFSRFQDLLASGLVDAVLVATPPPLHAEIAIAAMETGIHCLTEKPLAIAVDEADRMLEAAARHKKVLAVLYPFRTLAWFRRAKEIIDSGGIGEIRRTLMTYVTYRSQNYYDSRPWRGTWKGEGGGVLMNQGTHRIDQFVHLAGMPSKIVGNIRANLHQIEAEDEAMALLEYPNGAWGYFYASTSEVPTGLTVEITGDTGKLTFRDETLTHHRFGESLSATAFLATEREQQEPGLWVMPDVDTEQVQLPKVLEKEAVVRGHILPNFCRAIRYGEPLIAPANEAIYAVEFANALTLSAKQSRKVNVPVDRQEYRALLESLKADSATMQAQPERRLSR